MIISQFQQQQQQQQPRRFVDNGPFTRVYNNLSSAQLLVISILILILGIGTFIINGVSYIYVLKMGSFLVLEIGYGFWCGVFFLISGGLGIGAAQSRSKCLTTEESIYIEDPMGQVYMPNRNGLFESLQQTMTYFIRAEQGIHRPNAVAQLPLNVPGRHTPAPLRGLVNIKIYSGVWHADKPVGTTYEIVSVRPPLTLDKVTQAARDLYGVEEHLLFGVDGIKIPNSVETQEAFWTHHSRRLYLLPPREPREERRQSKRHRASSVTGEEAMTLAIGAELHKIRADIGQIKDTIMTNVKIDIRQNLKDVIFRSLKCIICLRAPMKPPAAFQRCCQSIIGCMTCVETIYQENMGMGCPKCRAPRGCSNMSDIHGLDELLNGLAFLAEEDDNDDDGLHI